MPPHSAFESPAGHAGISGDIEKSSAFEVKRFSPAVDVVFLGLREDKSASEVIRERGS